MASTVGIELHGTDGSAFLDRAVADECLALLVEHGVVVYRDAHVDDTQLLEFSRLLGEVVVPPAGGQPEHPEVTAISLDPSKDAMASYRRGTFFWHIDGALWDRVPAREHPLVWTRPDGRRSLLIGATGGEAVGIPHKEGRALLDRLLAWSTQPRFVLRHRWRKGDLVVWDNTGMLHRALPYAPTSQRLLHRTTLVGELAVS